MIVMDVLLIFATRRARKNRALRDESHINYSCVALEFISDDYPHQARQRFFFSMTHDSNQL